MKFSATILLQILLLSISNGQDWKEYRSSYANFSVMVPGPMLLKEHKVKTIIGETEVLNFYFNEDQETNPDNYLYMITTYDFPYLLEDTSDMDLLDSVFTDNIDRSVLDLSGQLIYSENILEYGTKAKMWKLDYDRGVAKFKCFVIKDRFYLLQVYTSKDKGLNNSVNRFMQSFRTLK